MTGNLKVLLVLAACVLALIVIIWALVTSVGELSTVWYW